MVLILPMSLPIQAAVACGVCCDWSIGRKKLVAPGGGRLQEIARNLENNSRKRKTTARRRSSTDSGRCYEDKFAKLGHKSTTLHEFGAGGGVTTSQTTTHWMISLSGLHVIAGYHGRPDWICFQEQHKLIILKLGEALIKSCEWFVETLRFPAIATYADWSEVAVKEPTEVEASLVVKICKHHVRLICWVWPPAMWLEPKHVMSSWWSRVHPARGATSKWSMFFSSLYSRCHGSTKLKFPSKRLRWNTCLQFISAIIMPGTYL